MERHLYHRIFPEARANKLINREQQQIASRSFQKTWLVKQLQLPHWIQEYILGYCFQESHITKHNKYMRKIVYLFKNAFESRLKWEEYGTANNSGEFWRIDLSRISPFTRDIGPPISIGVYKRNHFRYDSGKYDYLKECSFCATNCNKCGQYLSKRLAYHYREFDNKKKEREWYNYTRNVLGLIDEPYYDRLWCNCKN
jgi:hypothetical protein